jgi:hypothetical protein
MSSQLNEPTLDQPTPNPAQPTPIYEPVPSDTIYMAERVIHESNRTLKNRDNYLKEHLKQISGTKMLYVKFPNEGDLEYEEDPSQLAKILEDHRSVQPFSSHKDFFQTENYKIIEANPWKQELLLTMINFEINEFVEDLGDYAREVREGKKILEPESKIPFVDNSPVYYLNLRFIFSEFLKSAATLRLSQTDYLMASPYKEYHVYHIPRKPIPTDPHKNLPLFDLVNFHILKVKNPNRVSHSKIILLSMKKEDYQAFVNDLRQTIYLQAHELYKSLDNQLLFDYEHRLPQDLKI